MSYRSELIQCAAVCQAAIQNLDHFNTDLDSSTSISYATDIASEVLGERHKQWKKWGSQNRTPEKWLVILMEEVGEAARATLEGDLK